MVTTSTPFLYPDTSSGRTASNPHYIAANTSAMAQPPRFSPRTGSHYAQSTQHLIATEHRHTNHAKTVIDTDTGEYL